MTADDARGHLSPMWPWLIVAAFVAVGYWPTMPPAAEADGDLVDFSAVRAFNHVQAIAAEPHPMGTEAIGRVRNYIRGELDELGIEYELQTVMAPNYFSTPEPVEVVNIIALIPGTTGASTVALVGHYDTVPATPGANDNSVAVAAMLETGRALLEGSRPRNDVLLLFTDAEEPAPRPGSNAFVGAHPTAAAIGIVVNFEATGDSGASMLVETSGPESWLIAEFSRASSRPAAFSFATETARLIGDLGTDFDVFSDAGVPGLHFAYMRGSSIYHTERDNLDAVSLDSMQHHGDNALQIARHFGGLDLSSQPAGHHNVFFSVGSLLPHYPAAWAPPLALFALLVLGVGLRRSRTTVTWGGIAGAAGRLGIVVAATLAWTVIAATRSTMSSVEGYFYFGVLAAAAAAGLARLQAGRAEARYRAMLPWVILMIITALVGRGFSYLFVWPVLTAAVVVWWKPQSAWHHATRFGLVAGVTLVLLVPAVDVFLQFATPRPGNPDSSMPITIVVPLGLTLMAVSLLRLFWPDESGNRTARR